MNGIGENLRANLMPTYAHKDYVSKTLNVLEASLGKVIDSVTLGDDDALHFVFHDGSKIKIFDDGQSCCESRYMRTDDDLNSFVGTVLMGFEIKKAAPPTDEDYDSYDVHEIQFLEVQTSKGVFTMASHNEHNGYYGGFSIEAKTE